MEGYLPEEVDHDDGDGTNNKWSHKVANSFGLRDAIEAYIISAKLVRFTLNLPFDFIQKLAPPKLLSKQFEVFYEPYQNAINFNDYGADFAARRAVQERTEALQFLRIIQRTLPLTLIGIYDSCHLFIQRVT